MATLDHVFRTLRHVVTQVIKTEFIIRSVRNIGVVLLASLFRLLSDQHTAHGESQEIVDASHQIRLVLRQIIVHCNNVNALTGQCTQVRRHSRDERLTFTSFHFCDIASVQSNTTHDLNVEGTLTQGAPCCFANGCESLNQDVIQGFAFIEALFKFLCFSAQFLIGEGFKVFLKSINLRGEPVELTQGASFSSSEDLVNNGHGDSWDCDRMIRACVEHTSPSLRISVGAFDFIPTTVSFFSASRLF